MGKALVIKNVDFSDVAVDHYDPTEVIMNRFNNKEQGKYKVHISGKNFQFLNLTSSSGAAAWQIYWKDITTLRGETISIGKMSDGAETNYPTIIFTDSLIDTITNKSYSTSSYTITTVNPISSYMGNTSDTPIEVQVPLTAVGLYITFCIDTPPEVKLVE